MVPRERTGENDMTTFDEGMAAVTATDLSQAIVDQAHREEMDAARAEVARLTRRLADCEAALERARDSAPPDAPRWSEPSLWGYPTVTGPGDTDRALEAERDDGR